MQHDGSVPLSIAPDVGQIEPFRHGEVHLDRRALPSPIEGILQFDIDLRTIEGALSFIDLKREVFVLQGVQKGLGRPLQSSSEPIDFSGRVLSSISYSKPKIFITSSTNR